MGKGSKQRPTNAKRFGDNYDKAFERSSVVVVECESPYHVTHSKEVADLMCKVDDLESKYDDLIQSSMNDLLESQERIQELTAALARRDNQIRCLERTKVTAEHRESIK